MIPTSVSALNVAASQNEHRKVEEELLTPYSNKELADGWEFKILRSASGVFESPERMQEVLAEEAKAGWILVEKFDRHRLRLKRSTEATKNDPHLHFDAWRTQIGASQNKYEAKIALFAAGILLVVLGFVLVGIMVFGPPG